MTTDTLTQWRHLVDPQWPTTTFPHVINERSFVSGPTTAGENSRFAFSYYLRQDPFTLQGRGWFGDHCEGPPEHAHGGSVAALLDEVMGGMILLSGKVIVAANLNINYHGMVPLNTPIKVQAHIERTEGRKVYAASHIEHGIDGTTLTTATGLFIEIELDSLRLRLKPPS